jgi:radical SAM superfamily enzyme YgiQ (UPF0313 family)
MKRLLLINSNMETNPYPVPPLGLCLLQSYLENEYEVKIYDAVFDKGFSLEKNIIGFSPDFVGIGIRNIDNLNMNSPAYYIDDIYDKIIKPVKRISKAPLILGGSGFSIFSGEIMDYFQADYGVKGEGEVVLPYLLKCITENKVPDHPQIISKNEKFAGTVSDCFDISGFNKSEIDVKLDFTPYGGKGSYPVQTKRGCGHKCIYCSYPLIEGKSFRRRSPVDIADEIEEAYFRLGPATFEFVDSTFNDPPGHAEEICREIIKRKMNISLRTMGINPENTTAELFELMMKAGFSQIDCTPDTASEKMLVNFKKNFSKASLENTAKLIKMFNIPTMWFFIFGGPGETDKTCDETLEFIDRNINKLDMIHSTFGLRIYPGTSLYDTAVLEGVINGYDNILKPKFYFSAKISYKNLHDKISGFSKAHPNLVTINEVTPSAEMMERAIAMKKKLNLTEPMFRTLLRARYEDFGINAN